MKSMVLMLDISFELILHCLAKSFKNSMRLYLFETDFERSNVGMFLYDLRGFSVNFLV
jgi:hypothetical protein